MITSPQPAAWNRPAMVSAVFAALAAALLASGCASRLSQPFAKNPYFGDTATGQMGNDYVPRETRRVQPWWPLF